jgi:hypothetical protein
MVPVMLIKLAGLEENFEGFKKKYLPPMPGAVGANLCVRPLMPGQAVQDLLCRADTQVCPYSSAPEKGALIPFIDFITEYISC